MDLFQWAFSVAATQEVEEELSQDENQLKPEKTLRRKTKAIFNVVHLEQIQISFHTGRVHLPTPINVVRQCKTILPRKYPQNVDEGSIGLNWTMNNLFQIQTSLLSSFKIHIHCSNKNQNFQVYNNVSNCFDETNVYRYMVPVQQAMAPIKLCFIHFVL